MGRVFAGRELDIGRSGLAGLGGNRRGVTSRAGCCLMRCQLATLSKRDARTVAASAESVETEAQHLGEDGNRALDEAVRAHCLEMSKQQGLS
jgi:hypothetical protein